MSEPHLRLLQCNTCKSLEELPDYQGDPRRDDVLNFLLERHKFPDGNEHFGHMHRVESKIWQNARYRKDIEDRIREANGHTGFDTGFYATRDTLKEDALTCFQKHLRNPACPDYKTESKRLSPGTNAERKEAGLDKYQSKTFLCHYCPVHSLVMAAKNDKLFA